MPDHFFAEVKSALRLSLHRSFRVEISLSLREVVESEGVVCDRTGIAQAQLFLDASDIVNGAGLLKPLRIASLVGIWARVACGSSRIGYRSSHRFGKGESSGAFAAHSHAIDGALDNGCDSRNILTLIRSMLGFLLIPLFF